MEKCIKSAKSLIILSMLLMAFVILPNYVHAEYCNDTITGTAFDSYADITGFTTAQIDTCAYLDGDIVFGQACLAAGDRPQETGPGTITCVVDGPIMIDGTIKANLAANWKEGKKFNPKNGATSTMCASGAWHKECVSPGDGTTCTPATCCKSNKCAGLNRNTTGYDWCTGLTSTCGDCLSGYVDGDGNPATKEACTAPQNYWTFSSNNIYNNNSGNVGIGTSAPAGQLHVKGTGVDTFTDIESTGANFAAQLRFKSASNPAYTYVGPADDGNFNIWDADNKSIVIATNNISRMWIANTGNVGIGTNAPDELLQVSGSAVGAGAHIGNAYIGVWDGGTTYAVFTHNSLKTTNASYALIQQDNGNTYLNAAASTSLHFRINNVEKMIMDTNGNVGIGTATPGAKLEVAGQIKITGGDPGAGKVLTSDVAGLATWADAAGGGTSTFVGVSTGTFGAVMTGYENANTKCSSVPAYGTGAHVCSMAEMLASYTSPSTALTGAAGQAWVNGGSPGYYANLKDCLAWTSKSGAELGRYWNFNTAGTTNDDRAEITECTSGFQFACCK